LAPAPPIEEDEEWVGPPVQSIENNPTLAFEKIPYCVEPYIMQHLLVKIVNDWKTTQDPKHKDLLKESLFKFANSMLSKTEAGEFISHIASS